MSIKLLVASLDTVTSAGLKATLEGEFDLRIESGGCAPLPALVERHRPDVVMFDPAHLKQDGSDGACDARSWIFASEAPCCPGTGLQAAAPKGAVAYSDVCDEDFVTSVLAAGIKGFVLRSDPPLLLAMGIRAVAAEQTFLTPSLSHLVERALLRPQADAPTARERQILLLLADGKTNKHIARTLGLSVRTIEAHRMALMRKMGVHSAAELIRVALRRGLIEP